MEDFEKLHLLIQTINIIFVGHVDAGKSTLCGQILNLKNVVDSRTLQKYKEEAKKTGKENWYLSWCMDTNPEEREKGITTELGKASFDLPNRKVKILDAPGHKQFIFEMISGSNYADVGVLVVSARIKEFEAGFEKGGQTKENIYLMKCSTIQKIVVLVNKMDDPTVLWSIDRFNEIKMKLEKFLSKIFPDTVFIPVSGLKGDNIAIVGNTNENNNKWYDGPSFFEYLNEVPIKERDFENLNVVVTDKYNYVGSNLICVKVDGGILKKNDVVKVLPNNVEVQISSILTMEDVEIDKCYPGDTVNIKLKTDSKDFAVGSRLVNTNNNSFICTKEFSSAVNVLGSTPFFSVGLTCMLHIGVVQVGCKIVDIKINGNNNKFIRVNNSGSVKIECDREIVLLDENVLERFVLRCDEKTIGVGKVNKPEVKKVKE